MDDYTRIAPYYEKLLSKALLPVRNNIATFLKYQEHRKILDVCCGTGKQLEMLIAPEMELFGLDNSRSMLLQADQQSGIVYYRRDAIEMDFPEDSFDAVILTFSLHEQEALDRDIILKNCWNLVRPGGHLILGDYCQIPSGPVGFFWGKIMIPLLERTAGKKHFSNYTTWMREGALDMQINRIHSRKSLISKHFGGAVSVCALEKEPYQKAVFRSLNKTLGLPILP